jgi:Tannase and feruloyl esterase
MKLPDVMLAAILMNMLDAPASPAATCESLSSLSLPETTITVAQTVAPGAFALPKDFVGAKNCWFQPCPISNGPGDVFKDLPTFCRVAATLKPTSDSDIEIEIWMPVSGWNGKFIAVGNGGWAGTISFAAMGVAVARGYAVASTNTGHDGSVGDGSFALGHPEKLIDFGYRAVHEMTVKAKSIVAAFYAKAPTLSYWNGCSTGGRQALMEAQRFPADFDGMIAGAPANNKTHLVAQSLWIAQAVHKDEASYIPPMKYPLIHNAVLEMCDALDGVKDGVLEDPTRCKFDPKVLECKGADGPGCLTAPQVEAARKIYTPATNPRTKQQIFPALEPGSELGWAAKAGPEANAMAISHWRYVVFKDPNWDYKTFNFDTDMALGDKIENGNENATNPNLKAFFGHGGKLLQYHGWSDQLISPRNSINYYENVLATMGGASRVNQSYRLFMVPGMAHCSGGDGPNQFDTIGVLEQWVEKGKAPDQIIASRIRDGKTDRTRPLCPYPQVATYKGSGSTDVAENFSCSVPK